MNRKNIKKLVEIFDINICPKCLAGNIRRYSPDFYRQCKLCGFVCFDNCLSCRYYDACDKFIKK